MYYAFQIPATCRCGSFGSYTSFFRETKKGAILGLFSGTTSENCTRCSLKRQFCSGEGFSRALGKSLNDSTLRGMKTLYLKLKKSTDEMKTLLKSPRGLPLKLGSFDAEVCDYITGDPGSIPRLPSPRVGPLMARRLKTSSDVPVPMSR